MGRIVARGLLALIVAGTCRLAGAEVFVLTSGGRISGTWLNADESPRQKYLIQTDHGRIALEPAQVQKILRPSAVEQEYERIAPTFPDTVEGQWKLAEWCLDHKLLAQRKTHLERVIERDPEHAKARAMLGYVKADGKWFTQKEFQESRGMVRKGDRWLTTQDAAIEDQREKEKLARLEWNQKIRRWQDWLETDRDLQAQANFRGIHDRFAVWGLGKILQTDTRQRPRLLYVEVLSKIDAPEAMQTLANVSVFDNDSEVRLTCLDYLKTKKSRETIDFYVACLRTKSSTPTMSAPEIITNAAVALRFMNDPSVIRPLIDALITYHKKKVSDGAPPGSTTATMGKGPNGGGVGMSAGGGGPKFVTIEFRSQAVLETLLTLTNGVNFEFDVRAWLNWYSRRKSMETIVSRRSETADPTRVNPVAPAPSGK